MVNTIKYLTKKKNVKMDEKWPFYHRWGMGKSEIMECEGCIHTTLLLDGDLNFKCKFTDNKIPNAGLRINEDCPLLYLGEPKTVKW